MASEVASSSGSSHSDQNHYQALGISQDASQKDIRQAYLAKSRECHPNTVRGLGEDLDELRKQKQQEWTRVHEAYSVLSDPKQRENYDKGITPAATSPKRITMAEAKGKKTNEQLALESLQALLRTLNQSKSMKENNLGFDVDNVKAMKPTDVTKEKISLQSGQNKDNKDNQNWYQVQLKSTKDPKAKASNIQIHLNPESNKIDRINFDEKNMEAALLLAKEQFSSKLRIDDSMDEAQRKEFMELCKKHECSVYYQNSEGDLELLYQPDKQEVQEEQLLITDGQKTMAETRGYIAEQIEYRKEESSDRAAEDEHEKVENDLVVDSEEREHEVIQDRLEADLESTLSSAPRMSRSDSSG